MILLIVLVYITHQTLFYQFDASSNIIDGWETVNNPNFFTCGVIHYFGSNNINNYFLSRIFLDLEPHSQIRVDAKVLSINGNNAPNFRIDLKQVNYVSEMPSQNSICDSTNSEYILTISITRQHNRRTFWIDIQSIYGGLISLSLNILKCQYECAGCIDYYDTFCLQWKMHSYSFNQKLITNSDGWTFGLECYYFDNFSCGRCQILNFKKQNILLNYLLIKMYQQGFINFILTLQQQTIYIVNKQLVLPSNKQKYQLEIIKT
ncbi:unnamed protein product [Paramecium sonneborni]|uniref:Transmembrane protein n=1 Tax=Paramecium sonneborni TaxID=65129 RepID=A0A8S1RTK6_9CILI|nr:unnamed protein product [Paramecium sonneborni]